jgi:hypothetical protein
MNEYQIFNRTRQKKERVLKNYRYSSTRKTVLKPYVYIQIIQRYQGTTVHRTV